MSRAPSLPTCALKLTLANPLFPSFLHHEEMYHSTPEVRPLHKVRSKSPSTNE